MTTNIAQRNTITSITQLVTFSSTTQLTTITSITAPNGCQIGSVIGCQSLVTLMIIAGWRPIAHFGKTKKVSALSG
jgi:hypothetical protein